MTPLHERLWPMLGASDDGYTTVLNRDLREAAAALRPLIHYDDEQPSPRILSDAEAQAFVHLVLRAVQERGYNGQTSVHEWIAAALRPPEGEVGALCERLECHAENNEIASNAMGTADAAPYVEAAKLDRATLAHLRRLAAVEAERERMRAALISSALRFDVYACLHRAKKTPDDDAKAQTNTAMAEECRRALAPAPAAEGGQ